MNWSAVPWYLLTLRSICEVHHDYHMFFLNVVFRYMLFRSVGFHDRELTHDPWDWPRPDGALTRPPVILLATVKLPLLRFLICSGLHITRNTTEAVLVGQFPYRSE